MWYKNIAGRFFGLVTKHAFVTDRRTDGQTELRVTTPKTALAQLRRAVKRRKKYTPRVAHISYIYCIHLYCKSIKCTLKQKQSEKGNVKMMRIQDKAMRKYPKQLHCPTSSSVYKHSRK